MSDPQKQEYSGHEKLRILIGVSRASFLLLTLGVLFLASCLTYLQVGHLDYIAVMLVFVCGLSAHIAVNVLNEYQDFNSGLDLITERTPFNGGSGTLPTFPEAAGLTLKFGLVNLLVCTAIGLYLTINTGIVLILFGIAGVVLIITYTPWINRYPLLCLIAPGVAFGLIMVPGSVLALGGYLDLSIWLAAGMVFFLVNNLLLLNQIPDTEPDKKTGRKTLPVVFGHQASVKVAAVFYGAAFILVIIGWNYSNWQNQQLLIFILSPLAIFAILHLLKSRNVESMIPGLAANVALNILFPILFGISLVI